MMILKNSLLLLFFVSPIARAQPDLSSLSKDQLIQIVQKQANQGCSAELPQDAPEIATPSGARTTTPPAPAEIKRRSCWCKAVLNGAGDRVGTTLIQEVEHADGTRESNSLQSFGGHGMFGIGTGAKECSRELESYDDCEGVN